MNRLQKLIDNSHLYIFKYNLCQLTIPNYIIKLYIKCNPNKYYEIGFIYQFYYKNYELMHKYYNKAIDEGNSNAMKYLGYYYERINNYDLMKKYYLDAIKLGNSMAMTYLVDYYHHFTEYHYDLIKKYYLYEIGLVNSNAMYNLDQYYQSIKNYDLMAIELGNSIAMYNLGCHYHFIEKNYDLMNKYYIMAIKLLNKNIVNIILISHYKRVV